ncbi:MAG: hypothetical protein SH848_10245 [Saprospiraceae bacterium]|nr:hypothetical protein [Saprospiraceae bacterium]MDZ4704300.1 hypothetical protein [Saprospiraceae bacterium]
MIREMSKKYNYEHHNRRLATASGYQLTVAVYAVLVAGFIYFYRLDETLMKQVGNELEERRSAEA